MTELSLQRDDLDVSDKKTLRESPGSVSQKCTIAGEGIGMQGGAAQSLSTSFHAVAVSPHSLFSCEYVHKTSEEGRRLHLTALLAA